VRILKAGFHTLGIGLDGNHAVGSDDVQLGLRSDGYPRGVIKHAIVQQPKGKAEAAYARGPLFDKRRRLMADLATYC